MPNCRSTALLFVFALAAAVATGETARDADPNRPIATRQSNFAVPFEIPSTPEAARQVSEVQLYVSSDAGATWQLSAKAKPSDRQFPFRSPRDGEYWFAVATVDSSGHRHPEDPLSPALKVLVDTEQPRISAEAWQGKGGQLVARWQIEDPNINSASLRVEYQATGDQRWEPLAVDPASESEAAGSLRGEGTWWPPGTARQGMLKVQIADRSGNTTVVQVAVRAEAAATQSSPGDLAPPSFAATRPAVDPVEAPNAAPQRWLPDKSQTVFPAKAFANPRETQPVAAAEEQPTQWCAARDAERAGTTDGDQDQPFRTASARQLRGDLTSSTLDFDLLPPGERPRMVNTTKFAIEYEVEKPGPTGLGKVELYCTRDGGKTWELFATDEDRTSPVEVEVDGERIYGFQIVVQSRSGLGTKPPKPGDLPELWVGVDLHPPAAKLLGTEVTREGEELTVRWRADDDVLDPRPISLAFGSDAGGPFTPVAAGIPNRGEYVWRYDARVPDLVYLRLDVRDEAGNVSSVTSADAVDLGRQRPQGRIRTVRPLTKEAESESSS